MVGKKEPKLEWRFVDVVEWQRILANEMDMSPRDAEPQGRSLRGLPALLRKPGNWVYTSAIILAAMILLYVYPGQQEHKTSLGATLQKVIENEAAAWRTQNLTQLERMLDQQADPDWQTSFLRNQLRMHHRTVKATSKPALTLQTVERQGDLALVEVVVTDAALPWLSMPYRETRFYRQVVGGWLRTAPDPIFWGAPRAIDTHYFHFEFHQRDELVVARVAGEIDAIYRLLRRDMGLGAPIPEQQWMIEVVVADASHQRSTVIQVEGERLFIPAPTLWSAPVDLSDAAILTELVIDALSDQLIQETRRQIKPKRQWLPMTAGVERWLSQYWGGSRLPSQHNFEETEELRGWLAHYRPLRLADLTAMPDQPSVPGDDFWLPLGFTTREEYEAAQRVRVRVAQSVIAYAVTAYGHERLPLLLKAFGVHDTWETLIPAVFGVPVGQFEIGWQAYLHSSISK